MLTDDFAKEELFGEEVRICDHNFAKTLFARFEKEIKYYQTFNHPLKRDIETEEFVPLTNFIPLLRNMHGEIVSYIWQSEKEITFMLPSVRSKIG